MRNSQSREKNRLARLFVKQMLQKHPKVAPLIDGVFVFGSTAANLATSDSDIDIFFVTEKNAEKFRMIFQKDIEKFTEKHKVELNVQSFHTDDMLSFIQGNITRSLALEKILQFGCIPIYLNEKCFPKNERKYLFSRLHHTLQSIKKFYGALNAFPKSGSIDKRLGELRRHKGMRRFL
ncbi:MAG TPA: nucleotidyltransferase domain-containing protein [archaeon]|nr:nucleotidyltransferase domain-containing protein [archaeon]